MGMRNAAGRLECSSARRASRPRRQRPAPQDSPGRITETVTEPDKWHDCGDAAEGACFGAPRLGKTLPARIYADVLAGEQGGQGGFPGGRGGALRCQSAPVRDSDGPGGGVLAKSAGPYYGVMVAVSLRGAERAVAAGMVAVAPHRLAAAVKRHCRCGTRSERTVCPRRSGPRGSSRSD